jgi:GTPase
MPTPQQTKSRFAEDSGTSRDSNERVFLVGLDYRPRRKPWKQVKPASVPRMARDSSVSRAGEDTSADFSAQESMAELRELAGSAGADVVGEFIQSREKPDPATLIGRGKLEEIAGAAASAGADLLIFDHDLSPSQQRNVEDAVRVRVIDRTQLILDIFARHARTREGQLQVELAQLEYLLPRLTGRGIEMSQIAGTAAGGRGPIGTRGPGETQLETDRRKIARRIRRIQQQVENVRRTRTQQRQRRESVPVATVALVGYTNAGKSTLFNALTRASVLESPRLFATLDPTIRAVQLPSRRKALLSDTVGFIRNLPHTLVTSFRATLEDDAMTVHVSAVKGTGISTLLDRIDEVLQDDPLSRVKLRVPQREGKALSLLEGSARVFSREYRDGFVDMDAQVPESVLRKVRPFVRN